MMPIAPFRIRERAIHNRIARNVISTIRAQRKCQANVVHAGIKYRVVQGPAEGGISPGFTMRTPGSVGLGLSSKSGLAKREIV